MSAVVIIGCAVAGAGAGAVIRPLRKLAEGFVSVASMGYIRTKDEEPLTSLFKGAVIGGVLGTAAGFGLTALDSDSAAEACLNNAPAGAEIVMGKDALGNHTCTYR